MTLIPRRDYRNIILLETPDDNLNDLILADINLEGGLLTFQSALRCDFTNANLRWTHWRQADLSGSVLNGADMTDSNLVFAKMRQVKANHAIMDKVLGVSADFSDSIMTEACMNNSNFGGSNFTRCDLSKSIIKHTNLYGTKFIFSLAQGTTFDYSWFNKPYLFEGNKDKPAIFQKADITESTFYKSDLRGLDLTNTIYEKINIESSFYDSNTKFPKDVNPEACGAILLYPGMNISNMDLSEIHLECVMLKKINAIKVNFRDAYLRYSIFSDSNLKEANFSSCYLLDSTFENAILNEASFLNAKIARCNFSNADLRGADMRFDIKHFHSCTDEKHEFTLKNAKHDKTTIWPDGFDPREWDR